jgi:prophage tail gpP-like protein
MATPLNETVELTVNGTIYKDWTTVLVRREYGVAVSHFQFTCTEAVPLARVVTSLQIKPGDACTVKLAGHLAIAGHVYLRQASYDANRHGVMIVGRSKTGDLVDSSAPLDTGEFKEQPWESIARKMLSKHGIGLVTKGTINSTPFKRADIIPGESVFQFIERLARMRGIVLSDDVSGNLVAAGGFEGGSGDALVEGGNIQAARCTISDMSLGGSYASFSQINGDNKEWGKKVSQVHGEHGGDAARSRPFEQFTEHPGRKGEALLRSKFEGGWRDSVQIVADITVYGWLRPSGGLWQVGQPVTVNSPMLLLYNETLYVKCLTFTQDDKSGSLTVLTLVRQNWLTGGAANLSGAN